MVNQVIKGTAEVLDAKPISIGDIARVRDAAGAYTGEIRLGLGTEQNGGISITGVAGGLSGVSGVNGQTGVVSLDIGDMGDVTIGTPLAGSFLRWDGSAWVDQVFGLNDMAEVDITGVTNGQALIYDASSRTFKPGTVAASGASDNFGNHIATQPINMNSNGIYGLTEILFPTNWQVRAPTTNALAFYRDNVAKFSFINSGTVGVGYVAFGDYGTLRPDDSTTFGVDNLAYFSANGAVLKAPVTALNFYELGGIDHSVAPTTGQVPVWDGTKYAPGTVSGGGGVSTIAAATDVDTTGAVQGEYLRYNALASQWQRGTPDFDGTVAGLAEAAGAIAGQGLVYNGTAWALQAVAASTLGSLTNVTEAGVAVGHALQWNGTQWAPTPALQTDFDTKAPTAGDLMYFNGSEWTRVPAGLDGETLTLVGGVPTWA